MCMKEHAERLSFLHLTKLTVGRSSVHWPAQPSLCRWFELFRTASEVTAVTLNCSFFMLVLICSGHWPLGMRAPSDGALDMN